MATVNEIFGRINAYGYVDILYRDTGESITNISDAPVPVSNIHNTLGLRRQTIFDVSCPADQVMITVDDAALLNIEVEPYHD